MTDNKLQYKKGMIAAIACALIWGVMPIYWKQLDIIPSEVIIFYRIICVGITCLIACLYLYGFKQLRSYIKDKKELGKFVLAGFLITANWSIYIWAVNAGFIIQTSIGYYMEPLMVCVIGLLFFKEKLTSYKTFAFAMAILGVVILLIHFGEPPIIALGLALTFATYAGIKKTISAPPLVALFYETLFFIIPAFCVVIYFETKGLGAVGHTTGFEFILLLGTGLATAIPLGLFALAAQNLPLITLGITEYFSPSLALVIGIYLYKEPFDKVQFMAFLAIWIGLVVFTYGEKKEYEE